MPTKEIIRLSATPEGFGQCPDDLTDDMFASELPIQHSHEYYANDALGLYIGVWDTTDMVEAAGPYPCDEFMYLLEGEVLIKNNRSGAMEKALAGQAFIIPRGYDCQWHQAGYLRKFYVIYEDPNKPIPEKPAFEGIIVPNTDSPMEALTSAAAFLSKDSASVQKQHIFYTNNDGNFLSGSWQSEAFESPSRPVPYHQFSCIISGLLTLTDEGRQVHEFHPGDALFMPQGVVCSARATEKVVLLFAILKPA